MQKIWKVLVPFLACMAFFSVTAFANIYPPTLENGKLVLVDGGMGVGRYADRTSVVVAQYEPPIYRIAINVVSVTFSEEYWRRNKTYVGGPYTISSLFPIQFRYDWDRKAISFFNGKSWKDWDINSNHCHADGDPMIPNTAEAAFVSAYNMRFFNDKIGYDPVLKRGQRVIAESFYRALGI